MWRALYARGMSSSNTTSKRSPEQKRDRHGDRGVPPPPAFALADVPADSLLTEAEVAGLLRVT